jgi:ADP-ribosylglycohydrolase
MSLDARARARLSLDGLSVGDAFGERFFGPSEDALGRIARRELPPAPWRYTDDTEMALSIVEILEELGRIDQNKLAQRFAARMQKGRGYGPGAFELLHGVKAGHDWRFLSRSAFRGMGLFGNGGAMRAAPLGAFFADEPIRSIADQAKASAEVTHAHPEGMAGAIAVAVSVALAWRARSEARPLGSEWLQAIYDATPKGYTRDGIAEALAVAGAVSPREAAEKLGNGSGVSAPDTVPFCVWIAAWHGHDFETALWATVSALGDRDTTCAIVGGILAPKTGREQIPAVWLAAREELPI